MLGALINEPARLAPPTKRWAMRGGTIPGAHAAVHSQRPQRRKRASRSWEARPAAGAAAHVAAELGALKSNNNKKKSLTAKNGSTQSRADSGRRGASEKDVSLSLALLELLVFHGADLKLQTVETGTEKKRTCLAKAHNHFP